LTEKSGCLPSTTDEWPFPADLVNSGRAEAQPDESRALAVY